MTRRELLRSMGVALAALAAADVSALFPQRVNWREWNKVAVTGWPDGRVAASINDIDVTHDPQQLRRVLSILRPEGDTFHMFRGVWTVGPNEAIHGPVRGPIMASTQVKFDCDDPLDWMPRLFAYVDAPMLYIKSGFVREKGRDAWITIS